MNKLVLALTAGLLLAAGVSADNHAPGQVVYGAAGSVVPRDASGQVASTGAVHMNIPVAYTLHGGQQAAAVAVGDRPGTGTALNVGFSLGLGDPGDGLEVGALWLDDDLTGLVQKQIYPETSKWPALAVGMYDLGDAFSRQGYMVATKQIGTRNTGAAWRRPGTVAVCWPPQAAEGPVGTTPRAWGRLSLAESSPSKPAATAAAAALLAAPVRKMGVQIDGRMSPGEWDDAQQQTMELAALLPGTRLDIYAKHDEMNLYLCFAFEGQGALGPGTGAEVYLEAPRQQAEALGPQHHCYKVEVLKKGPDRLSYLRGDAGRWQVQQRGIGAEAVAAFAAATSKTSTPVFEFAIALGNLYTDSGLPQVLGLAVCVHIAAAEQGPAPASLPAAASRPMRQVTHLTGAETPGKYLFRWPGGPISPQAVHLAVMPTRPDLWGQVGSGKLYGMGKGENLQAPLLVDAPIIDGKMQLGEWVGAPAIFAVPGDGAFQVFTQMTTTALYVAARVTRHANPRQVTCQVYVDPENDGGLVVRPDDRLYLLRGEQASCWSWAANGWKHREKADFQAAAGLSEDGTAVACEFKIPLAELGVECGQPMGMAVQMTLGGPPAPVSVALTVTRTPPAAATSLPGSGTYITVGWQGRLFGGISAPSGRHARLIAEHDGDGLNLGYLVTGWPRKDWSLLLGVNDISGADGARWVVGVGLNLSSVRR